MTIIEGAPSLKMRCVEKGPRKRKKIERDELPEDVVDRVGDLLPADVLEALAGLTPEQITGPGGLLTQLAGRVIETALGAELTGHLGHSPGGVPAAGNVRNGSTAKTRAVLDVPLDSVSERERDVLRMRFEQDMTQAEIGAVIGVSQMQISRIIRAAVQRLRDAADAQPQPA